MTSLSTVGSTEKSNAAAGVWADPLRVTDEESEVMAAAAAIPAHMRKEFLAHLQALICADTTYTVTAS